MNISVKLFMLLHADLSQCDCRSGCASAKVNEENDFVVVNVWHDTFHLEGSWFACLDREIIDIERRVIIVVAFPGELERHRRDVLVSLHGHAEVIGLGR